MISGERASQARSAEVHQSFLESSKNTLELVNATLALAKEASERAAHFLEDRAKDMLEVHDKDARALLIPSVDDRSLVRNEHSRSRLRSVAQKLNGFESIRFTLPREIKLTPACLFVRGMDYHLDQQFDDAITCWQQVALDERASAYLRSLAWYWIGYERNNLGEFHDAVASFQQALELAVGPRTMELRRILIESKFFDESNERAESAAKEFETLLGDDELRGGSDEAVARRKRVAATFGNVLHVIGEGHRLAGNLDRAKEFYDKAIAQFREGTDTDKWSRFGLAEALYWSGQIGESLEIFRHSIKADAIEEEISRMEPRTKALAKQTQLIACIRVPEWNVTAPEIHRGVIESIGYVNERLTVYSQLKRRNVSRDELKSDLQVLLSQIAKADSPPDQPTASS